MEKTKSSNNLDLILKIFLGLILLVSMIKLVFDKTDLFDTDHNQKISRTDFAICLKESGVLMYGSDTCEHCLAQKKMFGSAFEEINYINCEFDREICEKRGITGYPIWENREGERRQGVQNFQSLSELSNCQIPQ